MATPQAMAAALGGKKRPPDYRDVPFQPGAAAPTGSLAAIPIWMQNIIGCCSAEATAKYKQVIDYLASGGRIINYSPRYPYTLVEIALGGNINNQGVDIRSIASVEKNNGFATEDSVPDQTIDGYQSYVFDLQASNIPPLAATDAAQYKIGGYTFPGTDLASLEQAVQTTGGVVILVEVGAEWYTAPNGETSWAPSDILPIRPPALGVVILIILWLGFIVFVINTSI